MKENVLTIWQNYDLDFEEFKKWNADFYREEYGIDDDNELYAEMVEDNYRQLEDERANFDAIELGEVIMFGTNGRWNGSYPGYDFPKAKTVGELLYLHRDCDYGHFYVDSNGDLKLDETHHDASNHFTYRTVKPGVTDEQFLEFEKRLFPENLHKSILTP